MTTDNGKSIQWETVVTFRVFVVGGKIDPKVFERR